jgi:hypothetical protein
MLLEEFIFKRLLCHSETKKERDANLSIFRQAVKEPEFNPNYKNGGRSFLNVILSSVYYEEDKEMLKLLLDCPATDVNEIIDEQGNHVISLGFRHHRPEGLVIMARHPRVMLNYVGGENQDRYFLSSIIRCGYGEVLLHALAAKKDYGLGANEKGDISNILSNEGDCANFVSNNLDSYNDLKRRRRDHIFMTAISLVVEVYKGVHRKNISEMAEATLGRIERSEPLIRPHIFGSRQRVFKTLNREVGTEEIE